MILAENLQTFRTAAVDYEETEIIKSELARKSLERQPFFLTGDELERIFRWKLRSQYGRKVDFRQKNTESAYRVVTKAAFEIVDQDFDYECSIRLGLLNGVAWDRHWCSICNIGSHRTPTILRD